VSYAGKLLVSSPLLRDPNFIRTVVYVCAHDEHGALGVVLNRPNPISLEELMPRWAPAAAEPASRFAGGPVDLDSAIGLGWVTGEDALGTAYAFVEDPIAMIDLNEEPGPVIEQLGALRIYLGYAGWGGGQLEQEVAEEAWVDAAPEVEDVFTHDHDGLWGRVIARKGGSWRLIARMPEDPRVN
jgi:putative transcriptional regulator